MSGGGGKQTIGYKYYMGLHMGLCHGPIDSLLEIRAGDRTAFSTPITTSSSIAIAAPELFGGDSKEGGLVGTVDVMMGESTQAANSYLSGQQGTPQPGYRGIVSVVYRGGQVSANNPYVKPWSFRIRRLLKGWDGDSVWYSAKAVIDLGSGILAANPAHMVVECLTNRSWGQGLSLGNLDLATFTSCADTFYTEGLGLCFTWNRQSSIEEFIQQILDHAGAAVGEDPATGLIRMRALRADYSVGALPLYSPTAGNVLELVSFERSSHTDSVNEVSVRFTDQAVGKQGSITIQHLAAVQAQGGSTPETRDYPGLPTVSLAARTALRDLKATTAGLARVTLRVNRSAYGILPGDLIALTWPDLGIALMPLRVGSVDYGQLTSGAITLETVQDVFGLPATSYLGNQPSLWVAPTTAPQAATAYTLLEAPYIELLGSLSGADLAALPADAGYAAGLVGRPAGVPQSFILEDRVSPAAYAEKARGDFAPTGTLSASLTATATSVVLTGPKDLDLMTVGQAAILGSGATQEIVKVTSIDLTTFTLGLARGCADTVPRAWSSGTRLWAAGFGALDPTEYSDGEVVDGRFLTVAAGGTLASGSAPTASATMDARASRPYPPAKVRVNGTATPSTIGGSVALTWAGRNRLTQADQLIDYEAAHITPEPGTGYTVKVRRTDTNVVVYQRTGIPAGVTGGALNIPSFAVAGVIGYSLEIYATRDGLDSMQSVTIPFSISGYGLDYGLDYGGTQAPGTFIVKGAVIAPVNPIPGVSTLKSVTVTIAGTVSSSDSLTFNLAFFPYGGAAYTASYTITGAGKTTAAEYAAALAAAILGGSPDEISVEQSGGTVTVSTYFGAIDIQYRNTTATTTVELNQAASATTTGRVHTVYIDYWDQTLVGGSPLEVLAPQVSAKYDTGGGIVMKLTFSGVTHAKRQELKGEITRYVLAQEGTGANANFTAAGALQAIATAMQADTTLSPYVSAIGLGIPTGGTYLPTRTALIVSAAENIRISTDFYQFTQANSPSGYKLLSKSVSEPIAIFPAGAKEIRTVTFVTSYSVSGPLSSVTLGQVYFVTLNGTRYATTVIAGDVSDAPYRDGIYARLKTAIEASGNFVCRFNTLLRVPGGATFVTSMEIERNVVNTAFTCEAGASFGAEVTITRI
jgi:hypothetical protein